jgi:hypothetical protein
MSSLATRFREVELTRDSDTPLPQSLPANWLQPKSSGPVVRFVDSHFNEQSTPAEIFRVFPNAKEVQYRALTLRSIFLALARKSDEA